MWRFIRDVDRPFGGIIDVQPTAITEPERQATRDFLARHQASELRPPCGQVGRQASGRRRAGGRATPCGRAWGRREWAGVGATGVGGSGH
ncbi:hypothetical protein [Streptomyces sp. NPDC101115]|uniref:hypothetical protein n=1 Tax=Streptomyces sp. NPDC101115 TaxID=3366106 RepID=UPI0037FA34F3